MYTDITETELATFLAEYDIGRLLSYKGIAEGVENSNYLMQSEQGTFILTLYEKRVDRGDLPFFLGLMEHLADKAVRCPLPIRRRDGDTIGELAGRPAAVIEFLEGMWPRNPQPVHCREVGKALAQMHLAGQDFALKRGNALSVDGWRPLWTLSADRADEVERGLSAEIDEDLADLERAWPTALPEGVIHADLFPDNVFFLSSRLSGLIDFYFACNDQLAYDVAVCINAWCFEKDGAFNITKGMALFDGYCAIRPLEDRELHSMPVLARGAALRFFLTRIYDWLTVSDAAKVVKKDPKEYLRYLRFHRKISGADEYGYRVRDGIR